MQDVVVQVTPKSFDLTKICEQNLKIHKNLYKLLAKIPENLDKIRKSGEVESNV